MVAISLLMVVVPAQQLLTAQTAQAATTTSLVTGSSRQLLVDQVNTSYFPSGSSAAVVVQNSAGALHLGSNYAATRGQPVVVATSGTTATDVISRLSSLGASQVVLVSETSGWFTSAFQTAVTGSGRTIVTYVQSSDLFARWTTAAGQASAAYAVARTNDTAGVAVATAYANAQRVPLVLFETTTSTTTLTTFFTSIKSAQLTVFGKDAAAAARLSPDEGDKVSVIDLSDPKKAFTWVAAADQQAGLSSNRVVVGASDAVDELGLAGMVAAKTNSIAAPAGTKTGLLHDQVTVVSHAA